MTKSDAHALLDKIREGMCVAGATEALRLTGDIPRVSDKSLCFDDDEQRVDRPCALLDTPVSERFSYSIYLDSPKNERVTQ